MSAAGLALGEGDYHALRRTFRWGGSVHFRNQERVLACSAGARCWLLAGTDKRVQPVPQFTCQAVHKHALVATSTALVLPATHSRDTAGKVLSGLGPSACIKPSRGAPWKPAFMLTRGLYLPQVYTSAVSVHSPHSHVSLAFQFHRHTSDRGQVSYILFPQKLSHTSPQRG